MNTQTLADKIVEAVLSTRQLITRDSVTLYANGKGNNARHELQQRVEIVVKEILDEKEAKNESRISK